MKKIRSIFGLILILTVLNNFTQVQAQNGFNIRFEPFKMTAYGANLHVGDKFEFYNELTGIPRNHSYNYGVNYDPIVIDLANELNFAWEITYRHPGTTSKFGLRGWQFHSFGRDYGLVSSDKDFLRGVRMFGQTLIPLTNDQKEKGVSDVWFWGQNDLRLKKAEFFIALQTSTISEVSLGLEAIQINHKQNFGQEQWALIKEFYVWYDFNNHVTLMENDKSSYLGLGPSFRLNLKTEFLEGFLKQSIFFGQAKYRGNWTDVDDIEIITRSDNSVYATALYDGQFPFKQEELRAIPNTELGLKLIFRDKINESVSLDFGLGFMASVFLDVPMSPRWSIPGDWVWAKGSNWSTQNKNLVFLGWVTTLGITF
ncbi:hypothetical protein IID20_00685 [Patescibacteria group bacterium]|nr:hypothetical protein [Patescibacteria group bacterium]